MSRRKNALPAALCALAAGALTFLAVESAAARHVGLDLLLPVSGGAFLPGRAARLAACLVVGFALAATERGRSVGRALDRWCERDRGRWAAAAVLTALFFLWSSRVTVMSYMTMDEVSFLQAIAQVPEKGMAAVYNTLSHSAQENTSSISVLLCWFIGQFYRLDPDGYWYLGYHLVILFAGFTVIVRCVLVKTGARGWPVWVGCAVCGGLFAGVLLYALGRIAFTVTAAVAGTAAVALLLCRRHESTRAGRVRCDVLSGTLMVLCCLQRRATGYTLLCFWALAVAYALVRTRLTGGEKGRPAGLVLCAALTLALVVGGFAVNPMLESDEQYREAEYYRSLVGDYLKDTLTDEQFARAGVGPELAAMIHGWYYLDERVNVDLFRQLAEIHDADLAAQPSVPLPARLWDMTVRLAAALGEDGQMLWQAAAAAVLLLACLLAWARLGRRYLPELACALCTAGGAAILLLYLIKDGRFPTRVFLVIAIPAAVMLLLMALSVPGPGPADGGGRSWTRAPAWLCGAALTALWALSLYNVPTAAQPVTRADVFALQNSIESLADGGGLVISSLYDRHNANTDPLHPLSTYPDNLVQCGYCGDLAKAPEDRLYTDALFREGSLFLIDQLSAEVGLMQYLTLDWGPVQAVEAARLPSGVLACRTDRVMPAQADYTGWYEQNGMTYYFRDGQAVTGEQTIDGESYTFAPAGAQSQLVVASDDGMLVYTTDAYSLVTDP